VNPLRLLAARIRQWRADRRAARLCLACRREEIGRDQHKCPGCRNSEETTRPLDPQRRRLRPDWAQRNDKRGPAPIPNQRKEHSE
jgi:hypothetical protein